MPRRARIDAPGALHHVICRGIERRRIFWEDSDRDDFLKRLETILTETQPPLRADPEAWQTARPRLRQKPFMPLGHPQLRHDGRGRIEITWNQPVGRNPGGLSGRGHHCRQ